MICKLQQHTVDPNFLVELRSYLLLGEYPKNADKHQRYSIKRRASNFTMSVKETSINYR